jgi:phosphoribosylcarboxyaminoimidazole (NCAIR) mutase
MIEAFGHRLNVIYVPLGETELEARTALLSGVQMPAGHPVNVVGINRAVNAALSAAKMLSIGRPELLEALDREHAERSARAARALE